MWSNRRRLEGLCKGLCIAADHAARPAGRSNFDLLRRNAGLGPFVRFWGIQNLIQHQVNHAETCSVSSADRLAHSRQAYDSSAVRQVTGACAHDLPAIRACICAAHVVPGVHPPCRPRLPHRAVPTRLAWSFVRHRQWRRQLNSTVQLLPATRRKCGVCWQQVLEPTCPTQMATWRCTEPAYATTRE